MDFLIRTVDSTASGREIVRDRELSAEVLAVGRASENDVHLPDLAVEQRHLTIAAEQTGWLRIAAAGTLGFTHDGRVTRESSIDPDRGGEVGLGSYRLAFERAGDGRVLVTVRQVEEDVGEARDRLRGFGLGGTLPSKRILAWTALVAILALFLALPIGSQMNRPQTAPDLDGEGAVTMDASWSTGALSSVHHGLEDSCEACHVEPFVAVRDETCLACHTEIGDHAADDRMAGGMRAPTGGDALLRRVADFFNKPGPGACSDCHTEHEGAGRMEPTAQAFCSDCHEGLDTRLTDTALGDASDFGRAHPQFRALVTPARGQAEARMSVAAAPSDFNGLKFPHDMHLSTTNGVARMASRLDPRSTGLECGACHTPTADGVRFLPVDMEASCESCHSLVYDRVGTTYRSLSHGDAEQVEADLIAADRAPRRPVSDLRRRPGPFAEGGIYYGNFSSGAASLPSFANAMGESGICGECHYPADNAGGRLAVLPVTQRNRYFQHGWFDHAAHTQEQCTTCHAAESSGAASDLLLPGIETCRDCHLGESASEAEVPSTCAMCHSYHPRPGPAAAPPRIVRRER